MDESRRARVRVSGVGWVALGGFRRVWMDVGGWMRDLYGCVRGRIDAGRVSGNVVE